MIFHVLTALIHIWFWKTALHLVYSLVRPWVFPMGMIFEVLHFGGGFEHIR